MTPLQTARSALNLEDLDLPQTPVVKEILVEDYTDKDGEESLKVLLIFEESTDFEQNYGKQIILIKSRIRQALQLAGIDLFAYIFLAKPSELIEEGSEP